jgi:hypothetical protein
MKNILWLCLTLTAAVIVAMVTFMLAGDNTSSCVKCHSGIEAVSATHDFDCGDCHEGDSKAMDPDMAHKDMLGGKNPASAQVWDETCGVCHEFQLKRVKSTIMYTNTGMIKNIMIAWGEEYADLYAVYADDAYADNGSPMNLDTVKNLDSITGKLYRKFCGSCHVASVLDYGYRSHKSTGCSVCHYEHNDYGTYEGGDTAMRGLSSYPETHAMNALPTDKSCESCHNRSGRMSLSYRGMYDGNSSLVPTKYGEPGPDIHSEARSIRHMPPDIHHEGGMECIDCHTAYEIMGDGYYYENMYKQAEISCENCHGTGESLPETEPALREENRAFADSVNYKQLIPNGAQMALTDKGRIFSNVFRQGDDYYLMKKRSGEIIPIKTVKDSASHNVTGHDRLECISCHSRVVIQCYGCHTFYDEGGTMYDFVNDTQTPGAFTEKEDLRTFYPFPLAINQKGKISPVTPGCQTFFTHIGEDGEYIKKDYILDFRNAKMLKFAPFYGHNTGKKAVGCPECHGNPFFYGFGDGLFSSAEKTFIAPQIGDIHNKPLLSITSFNNGVQSTTADIVRENSRVFTNNEIIAIIDANRCIICHDKADSKYYGEKFDYEKTLTDNIHSPLLR